MQISLEPSACCRFTENLMILAKEVGEWLKADIKAELSFLLEKQC